MHSVQEVELKLVQLVRSGQHLTALQSLLALTQSSTPSKTSDSAPQSYLLPSRRMFSIVAVGLARSYSLPHSPDTQLSAHVDSLLKSMRKHGISPSRIAWNAIIRSLLVKNSKESVFEANRILIALQSTTTDAAPQTAPEIVHSFSLPYPQTDTYNTFIRHAFATSDLAMANSVLSAMHRDPSIAPNLRTYHILIKHTARLRMPLQTRRYIQQLLEAIDSSQAALSSVSSHKNQIRLTQDTISIIVHAYVEIGDVDAAFQFLNEASLLSSPPSDRNNLEQMPLLSDLDVKNKCRITILHGYARQAQSELNLENVLRVYHQIIVDGSITGKDREALMTSANHAIIEAMICAGYLNEASSILTGTPGVDLWETIVLIVDRRKKVARSKERKMNSASTISPLLPKMTSPATSMQSSLIASLLDSNGSITRSISPTSRKFVYDTQTNPSVVQDTQDQKLTRIVANFPSFLHIQLLEKMIAQSKTERKQPQNNQLLETQILSYLQECRFRGIALSLGVYTLVLDALVKDNATISSEGLHVQYEYLEQLLSLCPSDQTVPTQLHVWRLKALCARAVEIRGRFVRGSTTSKGPDSGKNVHETAMLRLQNSSWSIFDEILERRRKGIPERYTHSLAGVFNSMLVIHRGSSVGVERILASSASVGNDVEGSEQESQSFLSEFNSKTWGMLLRHAGGVLKRWELVEGFWQTYLSTLAVGEDGRVVGMDPRVARAMATASLKFDKMTVIKQEVMDRYQELSELFDGAPLWWLRRNRHIMQAIWDGDVPLSRRVLKRMKKRAGLNWVGAGSRRQMDSITTQEEEDNLLPSDDQEDTWSKLVQTMATMKRDN